MNAEPFLVRIVKAFHKHSLEVILIGNAAAALHGAPVTTLDFDFMYKKTPGNLEKLKAVARQLDAIILSSYYPVSNLLRVVNDDEGIQLDFMSQVDGVSTFASLRSRAIKVNFKGSDLLVASLEDIIKSKKEAGRQRDKAVLPILNKALRENEKIKKEKIKKN